MRAEADARCHRELRRWAFRLLPALAAALSGCITPTGAPRVLYPFWRLAEVKAHDVGCARVVAWVSKSGKQGLGLSVQVEAPKEPCRVTLAEGMLELRDEMVPAAQLPPPRTVAQGEVARAYLPFLFDNEKAWNRGDNAGLLVLRVEAGTEKREIRVPMMHRPISFLGTPPSRIRKGDIERHELDMKQLYPPPPPEPQPAPVPEKPVNPAPSEPAPAQPAPEEPAPSQPAPAEPAPSEPAPPAGAPDGGAP